MQVTTGIYMPPLKRAYEKVNLVCRFGLWCGLTLILLQEYRDANGRCISYKSVT